MRPGLSRRHVLAGLAGLAIGGGAGPGARAATGAESLGEIFARSGLGESCGFVVADLSGRGVLEAHRAERAFPPASVVKILTALYALDSLGPGYRFRTRILATGGGDLVLLGGGDPALDTDALGDLAAGLGRARTSRRLLTASGSLPAIAAIDADQPPLAAYNPAISGLNLNYNRAFLSWRAGRVRVTAPGERFDAPATTPEVAPSDRARPRLSATRTGELWQIPRAKLAGEGSLWLPVRDPAPYAAGVLAGLIGARAGTTAPVVAGPAPAGATGAVVGDYASDPAVEMIRTMLYHSTNLTAEALGLRASQARGLAPARLADSGAAMADWARGALGLREARIVNHSGLTDATRIAPADLLRVLVREEARLSDLLRTRSIKADPGTGAAIAPDRARLVCKTGTLDFVSALAGYLVTENRRLAFVIFAADPAARRRIGVDQREDPPGAKAWAGRARGQEQALLRRWVSLHGG